MSGSPNAPVLTTFTSGDIVVSVVGDGDGSGTYGDNQAAPIVLEEINPETGVEVGQMTLPQETTTVNGVVENPISGEYGSSSEGSLELAGNGQSLVIAGYGVNDTTYNQGESGTENLYGNVALAQSTSLTNQNTYIPVARVIADINANGTVDTSTALYNVFNTNNPRSVATINGRTFYIAGQGVKGDTTQGLFVAQDGANSATAIDNSSDTRTAEIYNGKLYLSRDSTQAGGGNISSYGNTLPTGATSGTVLPGIDDTITLTAGQANTVNASAIGTTVEISPENFFFANATTLYIADGGAPKEGGIGDGGLQKWTLNTTTNTWVLDYTLSYGLNLVANTNTAGSDGLIGLTGQDNANGTVTFFTTNETIADLNQTYVYTITDTLSDTTLPANESFSVVDTAAPDTNVRGIAFAPSDPVNTVIGAGSSTTPGFIVTNGSTLTVQTGGTAAGVVLNSGGVAYISGTDTGSLIEAGGTEIVAGSVSLDTVDGEQILSGGTAYASNEMLAYGGTIALESVNAKLGGTLLVTGPGTLAQTVLPSAGDGITAVISGFAAGDVIDLAVGSTAKLTSAVAGGNTVETVSSGGVAQNFTFASEYASNPFTLVANGASEVLTFNATTVAAAATLTIGSGLTQPDVTVAKGGTVIVKAGGALPAALINSGGSAVIAASGVDSGSVILAGGTETVSGSLATATGDQVYGTQTLISSGFASNTTIESSGTQNVSAGGTVTGDTILAGGTVNIHGAGVVSSTVMEGGTLNLQTASATVTNGVTLYGANTIIVTTAENPGDGLLATISGFTGGDIVDAAFITNGTLTTTVSGGNTQAVISGTGGSETISLAGTFAPGLLQLGFGDELIWSTVATTYVLSGQSAPANYVVSSGTALDVLSGGSAAGVTVLSGGSAIFGGTDTASVISAGGSAYLTGKETGATILAGGNETVLGTASSDLVLGTQLVSAATAVVNNETVYTGGAIDLFLKGAVASATTVDGGDINISGNATAENSVITSGGAIVLESPKATLAAGVTFNGAGSIIETDVLSAGYGLNVAISGFGLGDTIVLDGIAGGSFSYVTGEGFVVGGGAAIIDLTGSYTTSDFAVTSAGGFTTITDPTIPSGSSQTIASGQTVSSPVIASGTLEVGAGSTVEGSISLSGTGSELIIDGTSLANTITGFAPGETIVLAGVPYNAADTVTVGTAGIVTLVTNNGDYELNIAGAYVGETGFNLSGDIVLTTADALCYLRGTRILTPTGEMPVEDIQIGDLLVTRFNGFQRVKWIGRQSRSPRTPRELRDHAPVRIRAGALGENLPARDLLVSPGHSMLVDGRLLLAKLLVNGVTITQDLAPPLPIEYFQIEFEAHDCVAAQGAWSESFADAPGLRGAFDNAAEYAALYPDARPPEEIALCAPRPEKGAKLETALRPIVARAADEVRPGKLRGAIDLVRAPWTVEGWAWDEANPELPVLLEVLLDGHPIGSLLACAYRWDLAEAGMGAGRCAFFWNAPVTLPADAATRLHFRRASDGAALPGSASLPSPASTGPGLRLVG